MRSYSNYDTLSDTPLQHPTYLEREHHGSTHLSRCRQRHCHFRAELQCRHRIITLGAHSKRAIPAGVAPVADAGHHHVRLPVRVGERTDAAILRHAIELRRLS